MALSYFRLIGYLYPNYHMPKDFNASFNIDFQGIDYQIQLSDSEIAVEFMTEYSEFDELIIEINSNLQAYISVQALMTKIPFRLVWTEWIERPLDSTGDERRLPVRGSFTQPGDEAQHLTWQAFMGGIGVSGQFRTELESNDFLRRAVTDFNFALQLPLNEIPVYLARSIESAQVFFGGEAALIRELDVGSEVKLVKRLANDSQGGGTHKTCSSNTRN